jgi:energy-converting hydrogenase Eha subunit E
LSRPAGAALIALGTIIVGFNPARWDTVILVLPRSHGVHVHDLVGTALVVLGTVLLWRSPRPTEYE